MSDLESALRSVPFQIDQTQCYLASQVARAFNPAADSNPWSKASTDAKAMFKLFFVAICHQINWDVLQRALFERFFSEDSGEMLARAATASPASIRELLADYHRPERIRAPERAQYLRQTAEVLVSAFGADIKRLVGTSKIFGTDGLLERMKLFPVYSEDPLSKKANVFAQELAREHICQFDDAINIPPAIDYHIIRLYLRTGRVVPFNSSVYRVLTTGSTHRMRLVRMLRETVSEALALTASYGSMPVHQLNYLEWQLARNRCEREFTNCEGPWPGELVDKSVADLAPDCPYRESCTAYASPEWRRMIEPDLKKAFY